MVALVVFSLVMTVAWQLLTMVTGTGRGSIDSVGKRALLTQASVLAVERLYNRVQEGIEVLCPLPGRTADTLVFRDVLNHTIVLERVDVNARGVGQLVSYHHGQPDGWRGDPDRDRGCAVRETDELAFASAPAATEQLFYPAYPVNIRGVKSVEFTALSPTCVRICLTLAEGDAALPIETTMELKNTALVYQP